MSKNKLSAAEQIAKLQRRQIDAYNLGLALKEMGRGDASGFGRISALAADFLLSWAETVEAMIREYDASSRE